MTTVRFEQDPEKGVLSMEVKGHADLAQLGRDPVCAGASVLAMTLAQCVRSMEEAGRLQKKANILIRNGRVLATAKPKPEYFRETVHLYWVAETGMRLLAEAYPENISVKVNTEE